MYAVKDARVYVQNYSFKNGVPILSGDDIERITIRVLKDVHPSSLVECEPVPIENIMECGFNLIISPKTMLPDCSILGQTYFQDSYDNFFVTGDGEDGWMREYVRRQTVALDEFMYENEPQRLVFTEAHELGHWILHQDYYSQNTGTAARSRILRTDSLRKRARSPIEWTEWQADHFASCFLLPRSPVRTIVKNYLTQNQLTYKQLLRFENPSMRSHFIELSRRLASSMNVSRDCARIRLEKLFQVKYPA